MFCKKILPVLLLLLLPVLLAAYPLYSPSWGYYVDLPEDYELSSGDGKNKFSFVNPSGAVLNLAAYPLKNQGAKVQTASGYGSINELCGDLDKRLGNRGETSYFDYYGRKAALIELDFILPDGKKAQKGWGFCVELGEFAEINTTSPGGPAGVQLNFKQSGFLAALAYSPAEKDGLNILHFSALDSIAPSAAERRYPGPVSSFTYPRIDRKPATLFGLKNSAWVSANDEEAAQSVVDREFQVLRFYASGSQWKEAWQRFYRFIYRDSCERLADIAFSVERELNVPPLSNREFAGKVLAWVQSFQYERDLLGSDFINLVQAAREGRGDCDSRALLWAVILNHADIRAAIMVSRDYGHAMGLADLEGEGARFSLDGTNYLVGETTARVGIGLIDKAQSDSAKWIGVDLE